MTKKDELLKNAAKIISEEGIQKLTMDHLAKVSDMTKGGVLYHFESKGQLILQMNQMAIRTFEEKLLGYKNELEGKSQYTRAYALATLDFYKNPEDALLPAVFISSLENEASFSLWQETSRAWDEQIYNDDGKRAENLKLKLICDGIWFSILYGTNELVSRDIEVLVRDYCNQLVEE